MMAAISAAMAGDETRLIEKNEKLGKKLFITGKGRCNVTNACDICDFFDSVCSNPKFLYSAVYGFDNSSLMAFFEERKVPLKTERGNRVFPVSDHSSDIIRALEVQLKDLGVSVSLNTEVRELITENGRVTGIRYAGGFEEADRVIVATGGLSYPSTGSTGDGYRWAKATGHEIRDTYPALVPFNLKDEFVKELQGLTLKNTGLVVLKDKKTVFSGQGEVLFTHFGVSGPLILTASSLMKGGRGDFEIYLDLKPALSQEVLDKRFLREFENGAQKSLSNVLKELLPKSMIPVILALSSVSGEKKAGQVSRSERERLLDVFKHMPLHFSSLRGYNEAIITGGGVSVRDVNPSTMESNKIKGLYFCGEVLDVDAFTGGYNLQIAFSTGRLAGGA